MMPWRATTLVFSVILSKKGDLQGALQRPSGDLAADYGA
jgi:hypothetical protein